MFFCFYFILIYFWEAQFYAKYAPTIGVDYGVKEVVLPASATRSAAETVALDFWDLSGHPDFYEVRNEFYRQAQAVLLVYDVQSRRSFDACGAWLEELRLFAGNGNAATNIRWFLVANKRDAQTRRVSERDGRAWAAAHSMQYFETSAFTGDRVADLFHAACDAVLLLTSS